MSRIVGIDLGTTNSAVAVLEGSRPHMVHNGRGENITPSAVWQSPPGGELMVGRSAYEKYGAATRFKRSMGSAEHFKIGERDLSAEECSGLIIRELVEDAENYCRDEITSAVITVPANWKDGPRRATDAAGQLAGIKVERLINEPTAAAMAYGMREDADGKTIAIYDLGGGTFDITILRVSDKVFDVVTSCGDEQLGGTDFDAMLLEHVLKRLREKTGFELPTLAGRDPKLQQRVRDLELKCEKAKKELSFAQETTVSLLSLDLHNGEPLAVEENLTRAELESLIDEPLTRTVQYMESALRQAKLDREAIDEIVMVGGSSRIPAARERVADFFGKEPLTSAVNPDEAVALGAAIQAGIIGQDEVTDRSFIALDNVNSNLGLEVMTRVNDQLVPGIFSEIILKDTRLPARETCPYSTVTDNQTSVEIRCYEGGSRIVAQNTFLPPPIVVSNLPPRPAGELQIDVTFSYDVSQMLEVEYCVEGTDISGKHQIALRSGDLSEKDLDHKRKELDDLWSSSSLAGRYKTLIDRAEKVLEDEKSLPNATELEQALGALKSAIAAGDSQQAEELDLKLTDILFELD